MFDLLGRSKITGLENEVASLRDELTVKSRSFDEVIAMLDASGSGNTKGGVVVNHATALRQSTVWACERLISETMGQFPIFVQVKQGSTWVEAEMHDSLDLLAMPNDWQTQHDFISTLTLWSESAGNGYCYKVRDGNGKIIRLLPLQSNNVSVEVLKNWELQYDLSDAEQGISGTYKKDRIFHLRNFGSKGYEGLSTIALHREGIGLAMQMETHASTAYKEGLLTDKYASTEEKLNETAIISLKSALQDYKGASNSGKTPLFHSGLKLNSTPINMVDAQYIESRKMQKQEIASIYGVPLFLLNDTEKSTTWGTGLEQISQSFIKFSLKPRMNRLSQTLCREIIPEKDQRKTRFVFDTDDFTLGEFKERMEGYRAAIESGVLNPDECREIEGRNKREGGDEYRIPMNTAIEGEQNEDETANQAA